MALPILFELNQELNRLFIAGSRLSPGDPRVRKYVAPLKKYGEKSPVFLKLAQLVEELIEGDAAQSAAKLIETEVFLLSVISTQGDTMPPEGDDTIEIAFNQNKEKLVETNIGYRTLAPVFEALATTGSGRTEVIKQAFEKGVFGDPRLYKAAAEAIGDKSAEIADFIAYTVLPSIGETAHRFLSDAYDAKGGRADGRRLAAMYAIMGERMLGMVDEAIMDGSPAVKSEAAKIMADFPKYEEDLLGMLGESKPVREEAMKALVLIGSKTGIDRIMERYNGGKAGEVISAVSCVSNEYLTAELLKSARSDYNKAKAAVSALSRQPDGAGEAAKIIESLKTDLAALSNKHSDNAAEFLKMTLSEGYLAKAEGLVPNAGKLAYGYRNLEETAITSLFYTGRGDDFIWDMFVSTKAGLLNRILKNPKKKDAPHILQAYAFRIGMKKLSAEEFYSTFIKTDLYKGAAFFDYQLFNGTMSMLAERLKNSLAKDPHSRADRETAKSLGEAGYVKFMELYEAHCQE